MAYIVVQICIVLNLLTAAVHSIHGKAFPISWESKEIPYSQTFIVILREDKKHYILVGTMFLLSSKENVVSQRNFTYV